MSGPIINHTGFIVSDLERSIAFYELFGAEVLGEVGVGGVDGEHGLRTPGVRGRCVLMSIGAQIIELIALDSHGDAPLVNVPPLRTGVAHLAFEFDDLAAAYERLVTKGIEFWSAPISLTEGDFAGGFWCYCSDPDGIPVELLQPGPGFRRKLDKIRG